MPAADYDVIVVGSGITGLTASKDLVQKGFTVANIEASMFGGLVININELDGTLGGSGADLASNLMMELSDLGGTTLTESVSAIETDANGLVVTTDAGAHSARVVIVASGARLKRLGIPGEAEFEYKGVSQCADCDGPMCQGADVVVVGGGDSALQEALVLADFCRNVHVVHRRDKFKARPDLVDAARRRDNITVWFDTEVEEILGGATVEKLRVRTSRDDATREIACAGVFAYVGLAPSCEFVPISVQRDAHGALVTDASMQTGLPGVYAVGAVRSGFGGMLSDAIDDATAAATAIAQRFNA